jgi:hypothetical protein
MAMTENNHFGLDLAYLISNERFQATWIPQNVDHENPEAIEFNCAGGFKTRR